jgi:hypothetical protein
MAPADAAHTTPCPVALLADEAVRLIRLRTLYEHRSEELFDAAATRLIELEDVVLKLHPRSLKGAAFQVLVSIGFIDPLAHAINEDAENNLRRAQRALTSAAIALTTDCATELLEFYTVAAYRMADAA